jgi:hypothetical protein
MFRSTSLLGAAMLAALTVSAPPAFGEPATKKKLSDFAPGTFIGERHVMAVTPPEQFNSSPPFEVSNILYLNRCSGGCMVTGGTINDARQHIATYIAPGPHVVTEYKNNAGEIGTAADAEWNLVVQCVKEIYSPFNIVVTDQKPTGPGNYTEAIIAGTSADVGVSSMVGGVAPAHTSCEPNDNAMSFTFANNSYWFAPDTQQRVWLICYVAGQESAHHFGLDHAFEYFDGTSACNDPMTYREDCGGQKFFRNKAAKCGEDQVRDCFCGGLQNSHSKILGVFGAGQNLIPAPTVVVNAPANNGTIVDGGVVAFQAGSKRGIEKSELYLNGWKWADVKGAAFGRLGQPNPSDYNTRLPAGVPNGVIDIQVKAYDDLGVGTSSQTVTVTKGAPCTSADTCAKGQKCEAGKCFWEPPTGKLGEACTYQQFCESNMCVDTSEGSYCSQDCIVGVKDSCPMGFECLAAGSSGACIPVDSGGGCCSVSGSDAVWLHGGLSLFVLGLVMLRRRRGR